MGAFLQTIRTAAQKQAQPYLSNLGVTYVRAFIGLPLALMYVGLLLTWDPQPLSLPHVEFFIRTFIAGMCQIAATVLLIYLFSLRSFAVGTTYTKSEALITALLGTLFFADGISGYAWIAITLGVASLILLTLAKSGTGAVLIKEREGWIALAAGLGAGTLFALTSLNLRTASLGLGYDSKLISAGFTLVAVVGFQSLVLTTYYCIKNPSIFCLLFRHFRIVFFIGATSLFGSACWFTAMTLQNAAFVKTVGQIEFLFALGFSWIYFREKIQGIELVGIGLLSLSIVMILFA